MADRAWRATVDDATAPHAIVTDAVLAAAEDHTVHVSEITSKLIVAVSKGDDATTRRLRGDARDWRPVAMWLAGALVERCANSATSPPPCWPSTPLFPPPGDDVGRQHQRDNSATFRSRSPPTLPGASKTTAGGSS